MKKLILSTLSIFCFFITAIQAQYSTVVLNYEKSYFGENQPLPAERYFMLTGITTPDVHYMEVQIFSAKGKDKRDPIYATYWKRSKDNNSPSFNIPINSKLNEGSTYDVLINFYRVITERERAKLTDNIYNTLDAYIDQSFQMSDRKMQLTNKRSQIMNDLNTIVTSGMSLYRGRTQVKFESFSDMVKMKLKQIEDIKLKKAGKLVGADSKGDGRVIARTQIIDDLKTMLHNEVAQYLNNDLYVLHDDIYIDDYQTEKIKDAYYLAPHIGYGGIIFNKDPDDFNYGSGMYIGLSFPFTKASKSNFLSKTSLSVGAFVRNLSDQEDRTVSGPIFKVPVYAALGYRPFAFFRIQAGVAITEDTSTAGMVSGFQDRVELRPFVGISAEFNLWFNFGK